MRAVAGPPAAGQTSRAPVVALELDHVVLAVNDRQRSVAFREKVLGLHHDGDRFDLVGNMRGPGDEAASRGPGKAVHFFDPDKHLLEIRHYETP